MTHQNTAIPSARLREGQLLRVEAAGQGVLLARVGGVVHAIADCCSHEAASLAEGFLDGATVECPRHGAVFDLRDGRALSLPATSGVRRYAVVERGGNIELQLGSSHGDGLGQGAEVVQRSAR